VKRVLKWLGLALGGVVGLTLVDVATLYALSGSKLSGAKPLPDHAPLVIPDDSATLARGEHLMRSIPCGGCHGEDLGGLVFADAGPFALISAPNLTSGRGGRQPPLTDQEWELAIRHGLRRDSTSLIVMPSEVFNAISDADMAAMIAYLKRLPPVDREVPPTTLRIVGRSLLGLGQVPLAADTTPRTAHVASVDTTIGAAYGSYLAGILACRGCHGASLSGATAFTPEEPPVSNITPGGIGHYSEADFFRALREGKRPAGTQLHKAMPWEYFRNLTDSELRSLWMYLQTVPAKKFGDL
jgi:cytochrome c553